MLIIIAVDKNIVRLKTKNGKMWAEALLCSKK